MKNVVDIKLWERKSAPLEEEVEWAPETAWVFWRRESPSPLPGFELHIPP